MKKVRYYIGSDQAWIVNEILYNALKSNSAFYNTLIECVQDAKHRGDDELQSFDVQSFHIWVIASIFDLDKVIESESFELYALNIHRLLLLLENEIAPSTDDNTQKNFLDKITDLIDSNGIKEVQVNDYCDEEQVFTDVEEISVDYDESIPYKVDEKYNEHDEHRRYYMGG